MKLFAASVWWMCQKQKTIGIFVENAKEHTTNAADEN